MSRCFSLLALVALASCGVDAGLRLSAAPSMGAITQSPDGTSAGSDLSRTRFRAGVCASEDLHPDHGKLDEATIVRFLEQQHFDVRLERPRADLVYLVVGGAGTESPIRLRVAILPSADLAGRELHEAILQHGEGSWGVHRSNLAILGPVASENEAMAFAARTKLSCWGVFTIAGRDDTFVVPGGYTEL